MAKRFRFRLESVRRIRQREQDEARRVVAEVVRTATKTRERIAALGEQLRLAVGVTREMKQSRGPDPSALREHQVHRDWLYRKIGEAELELTRQEAEVSRARAALVEARKRWKAIEKLREKHWMRYRRELAKEMQAEQDEAARQLLFGKVSLWSGS